ncbi:MAG: hypothetical protein U0793_08340 [Gemmataceae bacterium]
MIATCPDCQRQMRLPDNVAGKQLRCPHCQAVFTAASEAIQAEAPPAALVVEEAQPAPAEPLAFETSRPGSHFDFDAQDAAFPTTYRGGRGGLLFLGAMLLFVSPVIDLVIALMIVGQFGGVGAYLAGAILGLAVRALLLNVLPGVFMLLAYTYLNARRLKGMVITGGILAIVLPALLGVLSLVALINLVPVMRFGALPAGVLLPPFCYLIAAMVAICAGTQALLALANPSVARGFDEERRRRDRESYDDYPERRSRRYD